MSTAYRDLPAPGDGTPCANCGRRRKRIRRRLCDACRADPAVSKLFPAVAPAERGGDCAECHAAPGSYRRGLCRPCYSDPGVRAKHPADPKKAYYPADAPRRRPRARDLAALLPTEAPPGSPAKEEVLKVRAALKAPLFVEGDAAGEADAPADLSAFGSVRARDLDERAPRLRIRTRNVGRDDGARPGNENAVRAWEG